MNWWRQVLAALRHYATVVIAVATAVNVAVAFFQWQAIQEANDLSSRPSVLVRAVTLSENLPIEANIAIENSGKGPAISLYTVGVSQVRLQPLPNNPEYPPPRQAPSRGVLGPGQIFAVAVPTEIATADQLRSIRAATPRLYVYGRIEYSDHRGRRYRTTFCGFIRGKSYEWCPNNNDAT